MRELGESTNIKRNFSNQYETLTQKDESVKISGYARKQNY
jgi:hypothetical protein